MKKKYCIVMPAFNEDKYIGRVIKDINKVGLALIVIDDGSKDNTSIVAKKYCEHVLVHRTNLGKGAALKTGCQYAFQKLKADGVIFMDSDGQHDAGDLRNFVEKLNEGNDIIFGVRSFNRDMPTMRIIGNRLASAIVLLLYGKYIPDIPSGYKALSRQGYNKLIWKSSDYGVELEIAVRTAMSKHNFITVPISTIYHDMDRGMTLIDVIKMVFSMIVWRITL